MLMPLHSRTILTCKLGRLVWVYSSLIRRSIHPNPSTSRQDSWHALQCSWLRFAATVIHSLQIRECSFLSDCEQLVHFINSSDHSNPLTGESNLTPRSMTIYPILSHLDFSKSSGTTTPQQMRWHVKLKAIRLLL
jgi:hypothetical protein